MSVLGTLQLQKYHHISSIDSKETSVPNRPAAQLVLSWSSLSAFNSTFSSTFQVPSLWKLLIEHSSWDTSSSSPLLEFLPYFFSICSSELQELLAWTGPWRSPTGALFFSTNLNLSWRGQKGWQILRKKQGNATCMLWHQAVDQTKNASPDKVK